MPVSIAISSLIVCHSSFSRSGWEGALDTGIQCRYFQFRLQLVLLQAPCILIAASQLASLLEFRLLHGISYCGGAMLMTFRTRLLVGASLFKYMQSLVLKKFTEPLVGCLPLTIVWEFQTFLIWFSQNSSFCGWKLCYITKGIKTTLKLRESGH